MNYKLKKMRFVLTSIILFMLVMPGSALAANSSQCFGTSSLTCGSNSALKLQEGFSRLGYSPSEASIGWITRADIVNFLQNDPNAYGFHYSGHGYYDTNTGAPVMDTDDGIVTKNDVIGNWHFVFVDSCESAANDGLARAFHIPGYSNRAFLGWYTTVYDSDSYAFDTFLVDLLTYEPIRQAALDAANAVPGSGTTPIRFYGDSSYYGRPY